MKRISALLSLLLALPALAEQACPPGQYQVCLMGCFCAPIDPGQAGQILKDVEVMASSSLTYALRQARDEANNARRSEASSPVVSQVGRPVAAALPDELRAPEPAPVRTGASGPASVGEGIERIARYLSVGAPAAPPAGSTLSVSV